MRPWSTSVTSRWSVVPLSPARPVWCVGEDSLEPEGPYTAVAIATLLQDVSTTFRGTDQADAPYEVGHAERQAETSIQVGEIRVLVVREEFGTGDCPWIPRRRAFFSLEAAEAAARRGRGDD